MIKNDAVLRYIHKKMGNVGQNDRNNTPFTSYVIIK